jgi:glycosyltransferase involved in cell wall biosynthesis
MNKFSLQRAHRALYSAFDLFPSRKGAGVHIAQFASTLFDEMRGGLLYVVGDREMPAYQLEDTIEIVRFISPQKNFLKRALAFGSKLRELLDATENSLQLCHFRDIWSGIPVLTRRRRRFQAVYEVNGLPSIELPFHFREIELSTLQKLRAHENFCLREADCIITPSNAIRECLIKRGADARKIRTIPNGADVTASPEEILRPSDAPARYIIYCGALQSWQGVETLLRAFALLADLRDLHLVICVSNESHRIQLYKDFAAKLEIEDRLVWRVALDEDAMRHWFAHAALSVAPLAECARNVAQGCAPLKILESMAAGVPVVASDLPSVREIMCDGAHGRLVHPDRPSELARAIRVLLHYPEILRDMGANARRHIAHRLTWTHAKMRLVGAYRELLSTQDKS